MKELKTDAKFCPYCGKNPSEQNPPHQLAAGTVLNKKYLIGNAIGEGGFGITYVGIDQTLDIKIAVKEYFPAGYANRFNTYTNDVTINYNNTNDYFSHGKDNFLREAKSIAKFSQETGIVDVREYFTENNTAYIVMEYLDGKNLSKYISENGLFAPDEIFRLMLPLMRALDRMHSENVIHRDLSPDNIMFLKSGLLKITDFGSARYFSEEGAKTMSVLLKPGYAPYEQYSRKSAQGPWTDVYGLCATIYKCITGVTPVDSLDRCGGDDLKPPSQLGVRISTALENALMYGLAVYSKDRCKSMGELISLTEQALSSNSPIAFVPLHAANQERTIDANAIDITRNDPNRTVNANATYSAPRFSRTTYMNQSGRRTRSSFTRYDPAKSYSVRIMESRKFYSQALKKLREQNPNIDYDPNKNYIYRISDDKKYFSDEANASQRADNKVSSWLSGIGSLSDNTVSKNYSEYSKPIQFSNNDTERDANKETFKKNIALFAIGFIFTVIAIIFIILLASSCKKSGEKNTKSSNLYSSKSYDEYDDYDYYNYYNNNYYY